jgi:hypothetical protein
MRGVGHLAAATRPASLRTEVKEVVAMFVPSTCCGVFHRSERRTSHDFAQLSGGAAAGPPPLSLVPLGVAIHGVTSANPRESTEFPTSVKEVGSSSVLVSREVLAMCDSHTTARGRAPNEGRKCGVERPAPRAAPRGTRPWSPAACAPRDAPPRVFTDSLGVAVTSRMQRRRRSRTAPDPRRLRRTGA